MVDHARLSTPSIKYDLDEIMFHDNDTGVDRVEKLQIKPSVIPSYVLCV